MVADQKHSGRTVLTMHSDSQAAWTLFFNNGEWWPSL